ncbi:hypothetical protein DCMF_14310 [Candidatus Formimonas warabiya]|uniref:B12-binding domain-containing radical SAM protein n=2 Tax=Formimonas warabiya TaxID=1761012 RepID=A0A3G1KTM2_FORW1|nr:hypothetical protein DCMF_14310 [Candidatus Formimonas warabiya]
MKKKILLIQPENKEINNFRKKQFNNFVQITIPYLAAFIDEDLFEITLVDEYSQKIPFDIAFDLIAITVNTPNAYHCYKISKIFRDKGAKVVLGGPHVTLLPNEAEKHCDYLVVGESEETWPRFLKDFYNGSAKARYEPAHVPLLKNLPTPRWDLLKHRTALMKGAVFATRGCPYQCRYCNLKQIYFDRFRTRPKSEVISEIKRLKSRYFVFWDDNFFADKPYAIALMKSLAPLHKRGAAQVTLADCMDEELLHEAKSAGCLYLFIGIESFSEASLKDAGKQINRIGDYQKIIQNIHRHNMMVQAGIVFGFDTDTPEVFESTLKACEQLGIDGATVSILTPLPQTPIYHQMKEEGRLVTENWTCFNGKTYVAYTPKNLTARQLYDGYVNFRKKFYSLSSFIKRIRVSRTHVLHNLIINLGYRLAIRETTYQDLTQKGNEVFWWYMGGGSGLDVQYDADSAQPFYPVGKFHTIAELKAATEAVYSKQFCEDILYPVGFNENAGGYILFKEIDGVLYINNDIGGIGILGEMTDQITVKSSEPEKITVAILAKEPDPESGAEKEVSYDLTLVKENGAWKLDNWYDYGVGKTF